MGGEKTAAGRRPKDIAGVRSGKVIALKPTEERRRGCILWLCRCDCGKQFLTEGYKISGGVIKSCGCARNEHQIKDLTGRRFGRLTALRRLDRRIGSSFAWLCRCDCGRMAEVSANALLKGGTKSCGCAKGRRKQKESPDITGQQFGRLTAMEAVKTREDGSVVWRCRCSCGKETEVPCHSLTSGNTKSCGCLRQENESPVKYMRYIDGTCVEKLENKRLRKDNTSGYTGVTAYRGKWKAQITFKKRLYHLGTYEKLEDAVKARKQAEEQIFGEFLDWFYREYPGEKGK